MNDDDSRVIAHIDLDCFYVQVERSLNPLLNNKSVGVVQYNPFGDLKTIKPCDNRILDTNGSLIAVSYEARAKGVKRNMRGKDAKNLSNDIILVQVPTAHGKADLTIYRNASNKIINEFKSNGNVILEKASIDEVYIDLTNESNNKLLNLTDNEFDKILNDTSINSYLAGEDMNEMKLTKRDISIGHNTSTSNNVSVNPWFTRPRNQWSISDKLLIIGSSIIHQYRNNVYNKLGYTCSSGISHNKMLAKIASAMHKPNKLTIIPRTYILSLMTSLPISRIPGYNGKLGDELVNKLDNITSLGDIHNKYTKDQLYNLINDNSNNIRQVVDRIWNTSYGIDNDPVIPRTLSKSIGCGKSFRLQNILTYKDFITNSSTTTSKIYHWISELSTELFERCEIDRADNSRQAEQLTVGISIVIPTTNGTAGPSHVVGKNWHGSNISLSRITTYPKSVDQMTNTSYQLVKKLIDTTPSVIESKNTWGITYLSMCAGSFVPIANGEKSITSFFKIISKSPNKCSNNNDDNIANYAVSQTVDNEPNDQNNLLINSDIINSYTDRQINDSPKSFSQSSESIGDSPHDQSISKIITTGNDSISHKNEPVIDDSIVIDDDSDIEILDIKINECNKNKAVSNFTSLSNNLNHKPSHTLISTSYGNIDTKILDSLPLDIKNEIIQSMEMTSKKRNNNNNNNSTKNKTKKAKNSIDIRDMFRK